MWFIHRNLYGLKDPCYRDMAQVGCIKGELKHGSFNPQTNYMI